MVEEMAQYVSPKSGQIIVNKYCQVVDNIFSFGDVCLTPVNEPKSIVSMYQYCSQVCHNILASCLGLDLSSF